MMDLLVIAAAALMIFLWDRMAKWQMAALTSRYANSTVYEMASLFQKDRSLKMRFVPLVILQLLAVCLAWDALPLPVLGLSGTAAILAYCVISYRGWMRLIRSSSANVR